MQLKSVFQYTPLNIPGMGGVEVHIRRLTEELNHLGFQVEAGAQPNLVRPDDANAILHSHGDKLPPRDLLMAFGFNRWVHTLHGTSLGRGLACREFFGLSNYVASAKEALPAHLAQGVVFVSEGVREQASRYFGMPKSRLGAVIQNAAEVSLQGTSGFDFSKHSPYFLFLGRGDDFVKNTALLEEAFLKVTETHPCCLIAAPGSGFRTTHQRFIGLQTQSREEKTKLIAQAAALVLPSFYEADSLVVWEAMALGTPLIVTNALSASRHIQNYSRHAFVSPRDVSELTKAMLDILENPGRANPVLRTWADVARETAAFYTRLKN